MLINFKKILQIYPIIYYITIFLLHQTMIRMLNCDLIKEQILTKKLNFFFMFSLITGTFNIKTWFIKFTSFY